MPDPERDAIKVMPFDAAKALADETKNKTTFADIFGQYVFYDVAQRKYLA